MVAPRWVGSTPAPLRRSADAGASTSQLTSVLSSPEIAALIHELEELRWTGRKGYPIRCLIGACLAKHLYAIPTWTRVASLIAEHAGLQEILGDAPSVYALYRFAAKLRRFKPVLDACIDAITASLRDLDATYGLDLALDASDLPAFANGQRFVSKKGPARESFSDPDASWGHRSAVSTRKGGGFYGFKLHMAACARTDLPVVWRIETAKRQEAALAGDILVDALARGFTPETAALDKGYDVGPVYEVCGAAQVLPIIPLRDTPAVLAGKSQPPSCEHGEWRFAGSDAKRGATKWRCPTAQCRPRSVWLSADRLHPLVPRKTKRWRSLYRGRAAVEREFGRLKHDYGLAPLRVRGLERVALHADLTMLARLSLALARARAVPLAA